ncbi:MAG: SDR family oxidoreductase [Anaerolineae bacterium]|nr:SDR family oxidoreductase [Anaerolineae bacterium]
MKLAGQTALVTGATRGIGQAIALAFAAEGAAVAVTGRDAEALKAVGEGLRQSGGRVVTVAADLAERGAVDRLWETVAGELGQVDILVNNAGVGSSVDPRPLVDYRDETWDLLLHVNLTVPYLLIKKALPGMIQRRAGRVINIASINSFTGALHGAAYAASKHGLLGLTRTLAMEVVKDGVTANAICPGPVHTRMNDIRVAYDAERLGRTFEEQDASMTPMGRRLEPEEIAPLAVYLASRDAAMVTGQAFVIDGGVLLR